MKNALIVGNSSGIGLELTSRLLCEGWEVLGVSRSASTIVGERYTHLVMDVTDPAYVRTLEESLRDFAVDLCVYCAGVGELTDPENMSGEVHVFDVNLMGMIRTASVVVPWMVNRENGHFIGLSSVADELVSAVAPSYHASKAGFTSYLTGLAAALKPRGVHVTTVRFGFVDTKMAKGDVRPLMMSVEKAADHLEKCIRRRPVRYTAPLPVVPLVKLRRLLMWISGK
jgi:NAD(P)-dependent dehydrogenase (short-subunit alcohol dehydrogenase family)